MKTEVTGQKSEAARASVSECGSPPPLSHQPASSPNTQSDRLLAHSKPWRPWLVYFCFLLSTFCFPALGQYSIDWQAKDGGGGTSTSALYTVSGTIGQASAGDPAYIFKLFGRDNADAVREELLPP